MIRVGDRVEVIDSSRFRYAQRGWVTGFHALTHERVHIWFDAAGQSITFYVDELRVVDPVEVLAELLSGVPVSPKRRRR